VALDVSGASASEQREGEGHVRAAYRYTDHTLLVALCVELACTSYFICCAASEALQALAVIGRLIRPQPPVESVAEQPLISGSLFSTTAAESESPAAASRTRSSG